MGARRAGWGVVRPRGRSGTKVTSTFAGIRGFSGEAAAGDETDRIVRGAFAAAQADGILQPGPEPVLKEINKAQRAAPPEPTKTHLKEAKGFLAKGVSFLAEYQARLAAKDTQGVVMGSRRWTRPARTGRSATS